VELNPAAIAPTLPGRAGQTLAAGPAGLARAAPREMFTPTGPAGASDTPSVFGERAFSPVPVPARRKSRGLPWRAGAVLALVAAAGTTAALMIRERSAGTVAASAASPDAGAVLLDRPPAPTEAPPAPTPEEAAETPPVAAIAADAAPVADPPAADDGASRRSRSARPRRESRHRESHRGEPGYLDVAVDPWASVTVDGKSYGQTPKKISLPPGSHRVVLRNIELDKLESVTVKIRSGETRSLDFNWR
jgi:hypothetical protein